MRLRLQRTTIPVLLSGGCVRPTMPVPHTWRPAETYFTTNGVDIERIVEMDAMMGTLDLVSKSDWVTIIPALMMTAEIERMQFSVVPLVEPTAPLDLVVIEPMRRTLSTAARAFLEILRAEAVGLNNLWRPYFD